jgi:hypothetical protein
MPCIYELILPDIKPSTTLEERAEVCLGLRKAGWTKEQAEAATGLEWTFDEEAGDSVRIVELVPRPGRVQ